MFAQFEGEEGLDQCAELEALFQRVDIGSTIKMRTEKSARDSP